MGEIRRENVEKKNRWVEIWVYDRKVNIWNDILCYAIEKYRENKINLAMVFIDLKKAYGRVQSFKKNMWGSKENGVPMLFVNITHDIYDDASISVKSLGRETENFTV